ncbi:MAG: flagellar hook-associated protein FlgL [Actinomycetota bacterium]
MGLRITDQGLANSRLAWVTEGRARTADAETVISSGRRIDAASDDPAAAAQIMRHDLRLQRIEQYQRNNGRARLWVDGADSALQSASTNLARAKTIAVQAGNDTLGPNENAALAADIRSIADEVRSAANRRVSGRLIFAGTSDAATAYDQTDTYLGDTGVVELSIDANETVQIGTNGPEAFGTANPGDPYNGSVFEVLEELADAIESEDNARVRAGIEAVDAAADRIGGVLGRVGAISQQLDAAEVRHSGEKLSVENNVSKLRDTDLAEAMIRLRSAEAGYQATLSATARGLSVSLLDFLR